jgi:hypothetical protein
MTVYYNEIDPFAAKWLRNLILKSHLPREMWTRIRQQMSSQMTCEDTPNAVSSRGSQGGRLHCSLRDGQQPDLFGREAVPVSRFRSQGSENANRMSATCGRIGTGSSKSVALQRCLENKLIRRLPRDGWMMPFLIWKAQSTPAHRLYCQPAVQRGVMKEAGFSF